MLQRGGNLTMGRQNTTQTVSRAVAPSIIRDSTLVSEYSFTEGTGGFVYNRVYPVPASPNLLAMPEQFFSQASGPGGPVWSTSGSPTITDNFATSPAGDATATRFNAASGSTKTLTQSVQVTAQSYTISLMVASNTGGAQKFRLKIGNTASSDQTTTATGFSLFTFTGTPSAGAQTCGIESDVANDATDLIIWGMKLEVGSSATPYVRPAGELILGRSGTGTTVPTWNSRGLSFVLASSQFCQGMFATAPSFTKITSYTVFKRIANPNPVSTFGFLWGSWNNGNSLRIATSDGNNQQNQWSGGGVVNQLAFTLNSQVIGSGICDPYDGNWHCLATVYDGANGITYIDGYEVARTANASVGTFSQQQWYLCTNGGTRYGDNEINYALHYNTAHSAAQVLQNTQALRQVLIGRGVAATSAIPDGNSATLLIWEGDSIANAQGVLGWPAVTQPQLLPVPLARTVAITGSNADIDPGGTGSATGAFRRNNYIAGLFRPQRRNNIVHLHFGANDLNTVSAVISKYVQAYKELVQSYVALGWKVLLCSCLPASRSGIGGVWGTNTVDDLRDYATSAGIYTASSNYLLRNWTPPAGVTFADIGYGNIDAVAAVAYFTSRWNATSTATGPGYSVTVNLSSGAVVTGTGGITINSPGTTFIDIPACIIFGGNGTGATATVTHVKCMTATKSAGGSGYTTGDTITLAPRASDTFSTAPVLTITASAGAVTGVSSVSTPGDATALNGTNGAYSQASSSGAGTGATFTLTWGLLTINVTGGGSGYTNSGLYTVNNLAGPYANATYIGSAAEWDSTYSNDGTHPNANGCAFFANNWMVPKLLSML